MATDNWTDTSGNWSSGGNWSNGVPTASTDAVVAQGDPQITAPISINSLTNSAEVDIIEAGANTIAAGVSNSGSLNIDALGGRPEGGSSLTIGGTLNNRGTVNIGVFDGLAGASTVSAGAVNNFIGTTLGTININGDATTSSGGPFLASLDIAGVAGLGAVADLVGSVNISGDGLLEFGSGQITQIGGGSELTLTGPSAFVADASNTSANSALTGLSTINGGLFFVNGPTLTTSVGLTVSSSGNLGIDLFGGRLEGGSTLVVGGGLTNAGSISIGDSAILSPSRVSATALTNFIGTVQGQIFISGNTDTTSGGPFLASLDITSGVAGFGVAGTLIGSVHLGGDFLLEFPSGQITTIGGGSQLELTGPSAFVADASNTSANSALTGLTTVNSNGTLSFVNGPTLTTSVGLTNLGGSVNIDLIGGRQEGGSVLNIGGVLSNTGNFSVGDAEIISAATVTATGLVNFSGTTLGQIFISANTDSNAPLPVDATLDITGAASFGAGSLVVGNVNLTGNQFGSAVLEFATGGITGIAANSQLVLTGPDAFVADASNTTSNSALTGLATVGSNASFSFVNGPTLTTSVGLTNSGGSVNIDSIGGRTEGGSTLNIGGVLTNNGNFSVGDSQLTSAATVTATGLVNSIGSTGGQIFISANTNSNVPQPENALLDITGAAGFGNGSLLVGNVNLTGNQFGSAVLEFATGEITGIAASSQLVLTGPDAFVADASDTSSDSALTGLGAINANAGLSLVNGPSLTTSVGLDNTGTVNVDAIGGRPEGGSVLNIGGTLTNSGQVFVGDNQLLSTAALTVTGLVNTSGALIALQGNTSPDIEAVMTVSGAVTNSGAVNISASAILDLVGNDYTQFAGSTTVGGVLSAGNVIIEGGSLNVSAGGSLVGTVFVYSGVTSSVRVGSGNDQFVELGGTASGTIVDGGNQVVYGNASGSVINSGGYLYLELGTAVSTTVNNGVLLVLGTESGSVANPGGFDFVFAGGSAVAAALSGGDQYVESGAVATGTVVNAGAQVAYGTVSGTVLKSGSFLYQELGVAVGTNVSSGVVLFNGTASGTVDQAGGLDFVYGAAVSTTVSSGNEYVESSATTTGTVVDGGAQVVYGTTSATVINSGGFEYVLAGATASGTIVNSGIENVFGVAVGTVDNAGGDDFIYNGGVASSTVITGGDEFVEVTGTAMGTLVSGTGGAQTVYGTALSATLAGGGVQVVQAGGVASATVIDAGGYEFIAAGGSAAGATISGGIAELTAGAVATGALTFAAGAGGLLKLDDSQHFSGTVAGFGIPGQIDLEDIAFGASTSLSFTEAGNNLSGTLTVGDGTHVANLTLLGQYTAGQFHLASDGGAGTLVTDPPPPSAAETLAANYHG